MQKERMSTCIICKEHHKLTDEHVIPEFVGGSLIIKAVCKGCNDKMGRTFEGRLSNNEIFTLPNFIHNISGKSKTVPSPLTGNKKTQEGKKVFVELINDQITVKNYPKISIENINGKDLFSINIHPSDLGKAKQMIKKKINRHYKDMPKDRREKLTNKLYQDVCSSKVKKSPSPTIKSSFMVDFNDLYLFFIKIAYEIGYYHYGLEFIEQSTAEKLRLSIYNEAPESVNGSLDPEMKEFDNLMKEEKHYIFLTRNMCYIKIYELSALVIISESNSKYDLPLEDSIFYEFNYKKKSYKKQSLREKVGYLSPTY